MGFACVPLYLPFTVHERIADRTRAKFAVGHAYTHWHPYREKHRDTHTERGGVWGGYVRESNELAHANTASGWLILINNQKQMRPRPAWFRARRLRNDNYLSLSSPPFLPSLAYSTHASAFFLFRSSSSREVPPARAASPACPVRRAN